MKCSGFIVPLLLYKNLYDWQVQKGAMARMLGQGVKYLDFAHDDHEANSESKSYSIKRATLYYSVTSWVIPVKTGIQGVYAV